MIDGISIKGFRSFGASEEKIGDLAQINIFIGKNNCGKSNVLRFLELMGHLREPDPLLDYSMATADKTITVGLQVKRTGYTADLFKAITKPFGPEWVKSFPEFAEAVWFYFSVKKELRPTNRGLDDFRDLILQRCSPAYTNALTSQMCNYTGGAPEQRAKDISERIHALVRLQFPVHLVGAFRRISDGGNQPLSGSGLINELRKLRDPELTNYTSGKQRFAKIISFVGKILGEPDAVLEIPAGKDEIYVSIRGKVLPLESLGTGIHELIILAAAVTIIDGALFCIEEPEIHLHPELQKKFVQYIYQNTTNQYFISSHSNAFFDMPGVNIYRCALDEQESTKCQLVLSAAEKHAVLMDLGYRLSDLLQANYIVWVEGPSDRIYINHWLKTKAPEFVEGLHYAIMFYGGRLLAHLCYDDSLIDDFIHLSCLNRNACIVIDSDRKTAHTHLNETKKRIVRDFRSFSCFTWVTSGRTIENYIPETLLNQSVATVHERTHRAVKWERFGDLTRIRSNKPIDKVAVAKVVTSSPADFSLLDLDHITDQLVTEIRRHNTLIK